MDHPSAIGSVDFHPDSKANKRILALNMRYLPMVANYLEIILENQAEILARLDDGDKDDIMDAFWDRLRTRWEEEERSRVLSTVEDADK